MDYSKKLQIISMKLQAGEMPTDDINDLSQECDISPESVVEWSSVVNSRYIDFDIFDRVDYNEFSGDGRITE